MGVTRVYLDSCVVIYLLEGAEDLSRSVRAALRPVGGTSPAAYFSDLTRLECRVGTIRQRAAQRLRQFDDFFTSDGLERLPIETRTFDFATQIRALHGTKTPDALHLATAIEHGCGLFLTADARLAGCSDIQVDIVK